MAFYSTNRQAFFFPLTLTMQEGESIGKGRDFGNQPEG